MLIYLNYDLTEENFHTFLEEVNKSDSKPSIKVYLTSNGGDLSIMSMFRSVIEDYQMRLILGGLNYSASLALFLTSNTPRTVLEEAVGMYHRTSISEIRLDKKFRPLQDETLVNIWSEDSRSEKLVIDFLSLTQKELDEVDKGREIYFSDLELQNALEKSKKFFDKNLHSKN